MKKVLMLAVAAALSCCLLVCGCSETKSADSGNANNASAAAPAITDGSYKLPVSFEGGTGKVSLESPASVKVKDGKVTATIVWSSPNYDYMIVDGEKIIASSNDGGSTFEIPVANLNEPLKVIADTTAMSTPHEIEYQLTFDVSVLK